MNGSEIKKASAPQNLARPQSAKRKNDPASTAGLTNSDFFKQDTWIVGDRKYLSPRYTVPQELEGLFQPSAQRRKTDEEFLSANHFDDKKFSIQSLWEVEEPRTTVTIYGLPQREAHASLYLDVEHGFTIHFGLPEAGLFSFTVNEFCDALAVARWDLDLDVMSDQKMQEMSERTVEADGLSEEKHRSSSEDET